MGSAAAVLTMMTTTFLGVVISAPAASASEANGEVGAAASCYDYKGNYKADMLGGFTSLKRTTSHCNDINIYSPVGSSVARVCFCKKVVPADLLYCESWKIAPKNRWTVISTDDQDGQPFKVSFYRTPASGVYGGFIAA